MMALLMAIVGLTVTVNGADLTIDSWLNVPTLYGGQANITLDGSQRTVYAGQLRATVAESGLQWISYCTDLGATLSSGPYTQMSLSAAQALPAWQTPDWAPGGIERASQLYIRFGPEVSSPKEAVALQALIWDALYDETPSLTAGRFQLSASGTTAGVVGQANSWIHEDHEDTHSTAHSSWWGPSDLSGQYRLGQGLVSNIEIVPEPSTYALLIAAVPICAYTFLRRRN